MYENEDNDNIIEIKTIVLGEHAVGKTNLINVAIGEEFNESSKPTLSAFYVQKKFTINRKNYLMKIWDTAGMEKFRSLTKLFYKDSKIIIFVYDITRQETFDELEFQTKEIETNLKDSYVIGIVGNKTDLFDKEEVDEFKARDYAKNKRGFFKLVSAKENPKSFISFLEGMLKNYIKKRNTVIKKDKDKVEKVKLNKKSVKKKIIVVFSRNKNDIFFGKYNLD